MLVLGEEDTREIDCTFEQPLKNGKSKTVTVPVEFEIMETDDWRALLKSQEPIIDTVIDKIRHIPLSEENGEATELNDETRKKLLNLRWTHGGLIDGFMAVQGGMTAAAYKKAKLKN